MDFVRDNELEEAMKELIDAVLGVGVKHTVSKKPNETKEETEMEYHIDEYGDERDISCEDDDISFDVTAPKDMSLEEVAKRVNAHMENVIKLEHDKEEEKKKNEIHVGDKVKMTNLLDILSYATPWVHQNIEDMSKCRYAYGERSATPSVYRVNAIAPVTDSNGALMAYVESITSGLCYLTPVPNLKKCENKKVTE